MKYSPCAPRPCYPSAQHCGNVLALCHLVQSATFKCYSIVVYLMTKAQHIVDALEECFQTHISEYGNDMEDMPYITIEHDRPVIRPTSRFDSFFGGFEIELIQSVLKRYCIANMHVRTDYETNQPIIGVSF